MISVVVGVRPGELLAECEIFSPPCCGEYEEMFADMEEDAFQMPPIPEDFIRKVLERAKDLASEKLGSAFDAIEKMDGWRALGETQLEVYGTYENTCVASVVAEALYRGFKVRVPKGYTYPDPTIPYGLREAVVRYENVIRYGIKEDELFLYFYPEQDVLK